jgi:hypothetical protein
MLLRKSQWPVFPVAHLFTFADSLFEDFSTNFGKTYLSAFLADKPKISLGIYKVGKMSVELHLG